MARRRAQTANPHRTFSDLALHPSWNYYFQARVLLEPQQPMMLPVAMDLLRGYLASGNLSVVMAAMSMAVLPVILIFLLAQKMVIEGVTMSGIKS